MELLLLREMRCVNLEKKWVFKKLFASREISLLLVLVILCMFFQYRNSSFLSVQTIIDMLKNYSTTMVLSLGMMCVLLIGGIDISIGSTVAFSGMCSALLMRDGILSSTFLSFVVSILIGLTCGFIIGLVITKGKVLPIITTLGFMNIIRGITYLVSNSQWVSAYQIPESFKKFAQESYLTFGQINNMIAITAVCYIIFFIIMKWTRLGRKIYAIGSNPEAALISGIKINRVRLFVYSLMGALCGLAGALWVSVYASAQGDMATGIEMDVIASCVLGGVSLSGGRGSVVGVFLGGLTMAIISKALPLIGISAYWQSMIKGAVIILAIIMNVVTQRVIAKNHQKLREA